MISLNLPPPKVPGFNGTSYFPRSNELKQAFARNDNASDDFEMKILVLAEVASSTGWMPIVGIYSQIAELRAIEELK